MTEVVTPESIKWVVRDGMEKLLTGLPDQFKCVVKSKDDRLDKPTAEHIRDELVRRGVPPEACYVGCVAGEYATGTGVLADQYSVGILTAAAFHQAVPEAAHVEIITKADFANRLWAAVQKHATRRQKHSGDQKPHSDRLR